ncbi:MULTISPECIES: hypothetical protein [unclassified Nocardioides]|uniref:hypothetical protein n=1 Tax=unclassified Nocardioides TaxID=2615069 RepID=UPI0007024A16|nr:MULTISPECIES: hypothetical protein [unclassified Nocardioides]KRC56736.1 hypothetical protein ASE19_02630 [Nocardioides sp. Root79]KRC76946.1 hypothetical protein ASE20_01500 [Nocardioides sp. Root240]
MQREQPDEDAAWRAIVDNYGDPVLEPDAGLDATPEPEPEPELPEHLRDEEPDELRYAVDDSFVPPAPPPLPRPTPDRMLAWLGVFGSPAVLLFFVVTGIGMPQLLGWALVGSFLVGFGYLVMKMPSEPRDPWDDGAVL